jgi:hypothetical protein
MKTLLYKDLNSLATEFSADLTRQYFKLEQYDASCVYDPADTLVVIPYVNAGDWAFDLHARGFRVVVDNLWEPTSRYLASPGYDRLDPARTYEMQCDLWFWYSEYQRLSYYRARGAEREYTPKRTYEKLAFMPMRLQRYHRDQLLETMRPWLDDFYYSYQQQGLLLPWDMPFENVTAQRYYDARWYDHTWFSIVAESYVDGYNALTWGTNCTPYLGPWPFITEKTFKPIALQHPFMVYGHSNTLTRLHELGFETFPEMFDETYDVAPMDTDKLAILKNNVANFDHNASGYSQLTLNKLEHNHQLFFDSQRVKQGFIRDIIEPLLAYAEQT